MERWFYAAAGALALGGACLWFLSARPILYTRLFVSHDMRLIVRREIMENTRFSRKLKRIAVVLFLFALGSAAAAFLPTS